MPVNEDKLKEFMERAVQENETTVDGKTQKFITVGHTAGAAFTVYGDWAIGPIRAIVGDIILKAWAYAASSPEKTAMPATAVLPEPFIPVIRTTITFPDGTKRGCFADGVQAAEVAGMLRDAFEMGRQAGQRERQGK